MARKKTETETDAGVLVESTGDSGIEQGEVPRATEAEIPDRVVTGPVEASDGKCGEAIVSEIPDDVKKILKRFPAEKSLYVDKLGGVYTKDTAPEFVKGTTLYKNPYFKETN